MNEERKQFINDPRISQSRLKKFSGDEYNFDMEQSIYDLTAPYKTSAAFDFGKFFHSILEHVGKYDETEFAIAPIDDGRKKEYKDFVKNNPDMTVVKPSDYETALTMFSKLKREQPEIIRHIIEGEVEKICYTDELKAMIDLQHDDIIYDWKTVDKITVKDLRMACKNLDYDVQAHHFLECSKAKVMKFVFFKKTPPYQIRVYTCEPEFIQRGKAKWNMYKERYDSQMIDKELPSMLWDSERLIDE